MSIITNKEVEEMPLRASRRGFILSGSLLLAGTTLGGISGLAVSCNNQNPSKIDEGEEIVSPNEDLMREHGLLDRMLLIYNTAINRISNNEEFNPHYIFLTASIVRKFVEDYHERLEENYVFPRLEKAQRLNELTTILRNQHSGGRKLTEQLLALTKNGHSLKGDDIQNLIAFLKAFNTMYRPHAAREDTVLFPAFKEVVSTNEYYSLGEDFEKKEHEKFGEDGFFVTVDKVAEIEKQIGINDLKQFTPK